MKRNLTFLILFVAILLCPVITDACPMCQGGASKNTLMAYRGITLFLALLPILGGGGIFYWIYLESKHFKEKKE